MKYVRLFAFLLIVWGYAATDDARVFATSATEILCEEVCTESTACTETCYESMMEFENGNDITCLEWGTFDPDEFCCGDYLCNKAADEDMANCEADCGEPIPSEPACGQYGCQQGENCENCPSDCGSCGSASSCDSDGQCESGEDKDCEDCRATGYCTSSSNCPTFQGGSYHYICVDDRCVLEDLPFVTSTCNPANFSNDCPSGWVCKKIPESYHGSTFSCPNQAESCNVCIPSWVQ